MKLQDIRISSVTFVIFAILFVALSVRFVGISFGLPSFYDPDEPFFIISGLKLLHEHTLDPGWFGHPGTTTIYVIALIEVTVVTLGLATGRFASVHAFGEAVYTDPAMIVVPMRLFFVLCGVACVWLVFLIGRRLFGDRVGLVAAGLLAIDTLHVTWSQVIRTDVQATVFMLLCILACIAIARQGRLRDYLLAGVCVGFACATKWPAATVAIAIPGACLVRCLGNRAETATQVRRLAIGLATCFGALFVASPFIFLDYRTVLGNLGGEAQVRHLGATGGSFWTNIMWYIAQPLRGAIGVVGLALAAIGTAAAARTNRVAIGTLVLAMAAFLAAICSQKLIWSRWIVPLLPFVSILVAVGLDAVARWIGGLAGRRGGWAVGAALVAIVAVPMTLALARDARERLHDTRAEASDWARANIPDGSTVLVEYLALDLLPKRWTFLFPAGRLGCIDGAAALHGQVKTSTVGGWRGDRSIVDMGTIEPAQLGACRADYAIYTDYDRYYAERDQFAPELAVYRALARGGTLVRTFRPVPGRVGGPVVRIVRLAPAASSGRRISS